MWNAAPGSRVYLVSSHLCCVLGVAPGAPLVTAAPFSLFFTVCPLLKLSLCWSRDSLGVSPVLVLSTSVSRPLLEEPGPEIFNLLQQPPIVN